ncbi:MAG TPA: hypothetical protein O0X85_06465 [Methanocorpusculum sp.]|nr:hypothetical protein [Methanocorpusculum sp.]
MTGSPRKRPPDQMNLRLGASFIQKFNKYMEGRQETKVHFIRAAMEYWMSVDGDIEKIAERLKQAEQVIALQQERIDELRTFQERCIAYQREIIEEKNKRIQYLTDQLKKSPKADIYYPENLLEEPTVAEPEPAYQNQDVPTEK